MILLQIFSKNKKFSDCFFSNWINLGALEVPVTEICLKLEFIESCEETGVDLRSTWFLELKTLRFL